MEKVLVILKALGFIHAPWWLIFLPDIFVGAIVLALIIVWLIVYIRDR